MAAINDEKKDIQKAVGELFDIYGGFVTNLAKKARNRMLRPDEVDDVVQNVFMAILNRKAKYDPTKGKFRNFLATVVHNKAVDQVRQRDKALEKRTHRKRSVRKDEHQVNTVDLKVDEKTGFDQVIAGNEWKQLVLQKARDALKSKVSPRQYQIFEASVLREKSNEEVISMLRVNDNIINLARSRVGAVYQKLIEDIERELDAPKIPILKR